MNHRALRREASLVKIRCDLGVSAEMEESW